MRSLISTCARLVAAAGCLVSTAFAGNIVANPGFETGDFTSWTMSGWDTVDTSGFSGIFPHSGNFAAINGCVGTGCIQADPTGASYFYQDLATTPGTAYDVTFYFAPGEFGEFPAAAVLTGVELQVLWGDSAIPLVASPNGTCAGQCVFDTTDTSAGTTYLLVTLPGLMATSSSTRLEFLGEQDPAWMGVDDISVQAQVSGVPEPSTSMLLPAGLGGLLALGFRRRKRISQG